MNEKIKITTVRLPKTLHRKWKMRSASTGQTMDEIVIAGLEDYLNSTPEDQAEELRKIVKKKGN